MKYLFILIFVIPLECFSLNSCEDKLQNKLWPIDCFLALKLQNKPQNSKAYKLLESWCVLYEDDLVLINPPKALFSLDLPLKCFEIALKSQKNHLGQELLEGAFLNSFL